MGYTRTTESELALIHHVRNHTPTQKLKRIGGRPKHVYETTSNSRLRQCGMWDFLQPHRENMPHATLCVCAGASAQGKKAPCRVVVLCKRVLQVRVVSCQKGVLSSCLCSFPSPIGFEITGQQLWDGIRANTSWVQNHAGQKCHMPHYVFVRRKCAVLCGRVLRV